MGQQTRSRLALLVLAVSALALLATSPGPATAELTVSGDVIVGPARAADIAVRFVYDGRGPGEPDAVHVRFALPWTAGDPQLETSFSGVADGERGVRDAGALKFPAAACTDGCTIDASARIEWLGGSTHEVQVDWTAEAVVQFSDSGPPDDESMSGSVLVGAGPTVPKIAWFGFGGIGAAVAAVAFLMSSRRFRPARLALAAGMFVVAAWLAAGQAGPVSRQGLTNEVGVLFGTAVFLAVATIMGLWTTWRARNELLLPVVGWLYAAIVGLIASITVAGTAIYRPYELVAWGLALGLPAAAAVTSGPLAKRHVAASEAGATTARGPAVAFVAATQVILLAYTGIPLAAFVVLALANLSSANLWVFAYLALPLGAFLLILVGLRRWLRGSRRTLIAANTLLLLPLGYGQLMFIGPNSLFAGAWEFRLFIGLPLAAVIAGLFGGVLVVPRRPAAATPVRGSVVPSPAEPNGDAEDG